MADISTLARPYAKAVFDLAREARQFKEWSARLQVIADFVAHPQIARLIGHPALTRADLAGLAAQALGRLGPEALALVKLLIENGRVRTARAISDQYEQLRAEAEARVDVEITSAAPVQKAGQDALSAAIRKRLARDVVIDWSTDESLIAGALIRAGDLVIDGSVRGELQRLQAALVS